MRTRYFALVMGLIFLVVGILGFVPALLTPPPGDEPVRITMAHGLLFGLFPVNVLHNLVHLAFGVWGVVVWRSFTASRGYARSVAWIYAVLAILGLFPVVRTVFGLVPIWGNDIWLHALIAIVSAYFGYASVTTVEEAPVRRP
ncbi:MAG: DUF4383 domain-containing protein [Actinomycetota bacterium]